MTTDEVASLFCELCAMGESCPKHDPQRRPRGKGRRENVRTTHAIRRRRGW